MSDWLRHYSAEFAELLTKREPDRLATQLRESAADLIKADKRAEALSLLDEAISQYPGSWNLPFALHEKGLVLIDLGRINDGLDVLRQAISKDSGVPGVQCDAWLDLGFTITRHKLSDLYDEAVDVIRKQLRSDPSPAMFPVDVFKLHAMMAMIHAHNRDPDGAREARSALDAAAETNSGLPGHPSLGLVGSQYQDLRDDLKAMLGA